jgi:hypothetical protein
MDLELGNQDKTKTKDQGQGQRPKAKPPPSPKPSLPLPTLFRKQQVRIHRQARDHRDAILIMGLMSAGMRETLDRSGYDQQLGAIPKSAESLPTHAS